MNIGPINEVSVAYWKWARESESLLGFERVHGSDNQWVKADSKGSSGQSTK